MLRLACGLVVVLLLNVVLWAFATIAFCAFVCYALFTAFIPLPPWRLLRLAYSPLAGVVDDTLAERQQDALEDLAAHTGKPPVKLWLDTSTPAQPERRTHAVWLHPRHPRAENDPTKPNHKHHIRAAILVGGNCQTWADMTEEAKFLLDQGLYVLSLTLSGYPDPDESYGGLKGRLDWTPTEVSMLDDGVAALRWLTGTLISASTSKARDAPVNDRVYCDAPGKLHGSRYGIAHHEVLVEGHSLGSCLAHLVAAHEPSVAVTVMQPLASIAQVSVYASINKVVDVAHLIAPIQKSRSLFVILFGMPVLMLSFVYAQLAYNGAGLEKYDRVNRCLDFQRLPNEIVDRRMRDMVGFHARTALSIHEGHYCVIEAALDDLMAVQINNDRTKPFSGNMALDLDESAKAHTKAKHLRRRVKRIRSRRADHGTPYYHYADAREGYKEWLASI